MSFPQGPDYPEKPPMTRGIRIGEIGHYTSVDQFLFFRDWINWVNNNDCNVRFDPEDGTTIVWYWNTRLPLGDYLYVGEYLESVTEDELRWHFAPLTQFPTDLSGLFQRFTPLSVETTEATTEAVDDTTSTVTGTVDGLTGGLLNPDKDQ